MKALLRNLLSALLALSLAAPVAFAQDKVSPETPVFTQAELDQMLAPIALYPDALLSQILMAATYPLEVVQAARWSKANSGSQGEAAVKAVDNQEWDPSVKSLVAFPQILSMMDEKLDWTGRLGDAFLAQPEQVMDSVQGLRQKAHAAGNLKTNEHTRVEHQTQTIIVTSAYPDVVYVPYYDPFVVYGPWWWPAYRPVYWAPWPGYHVRHGVVFHWSVGIRIGHGFFFGVCDWPQRYVRIVDVRPFYYRQPVPVRHVWVHEVEHRRGVPYRSPTVHKKYVQNTNAHVSTPAKRHDYGDRTRQAVSERDKRGGDVGRDKAMATRKPTDNPPRPDSNRNGPDGKREHKNEQRIMPTTGAHQSDAASRQDAGERARVKDDGRKDQRPAVTAPRSRADDDNRGRGTEPRPQPPSRDRFVAQDRSADVDRPSSNPSFNTRGSGKDAGGGRDGGEAHKRER